MQDTDPFFEPKQIMYRVAKEVWPDLDERFHELFVQFDANGNIVPTFHGEPLWDTVAWGFAEGNWVIRPGTTLNTEGQIIVAFSNQFVTVDQYGEVRRFYDPDKRRNRYERRIANMVADVLRDMIADAEPSHVEAVENNREYWG
jgi:hypothetical protein